MINRDNPRPWGASEQEALAFLARRALDEDLAGPGNHRGDATSQALVPESLDRKSTRLNSSHVSESRMPSSA